MMFVSFYGEKFTSAWEHHVAQHGYRPLTGAQLQQAFYCESPFTALQQVRELGQKN